MDTHFPPSRRRGNIFLGVLLALLVGGSALFFLAALQQDAGSSLALYLVISVLLIAPVPWMIYRLYALNQAFYTLERDGLRIRWGLRAEDIPLPSIEWVRPADELGFALRLPLGGMPGAYLGVVRVEGLGVVEFIASDLRRMLLVATPDKVYVISPQDPKAFVRAFRRVIELGSLSPLASLSLRPVAFVGRVWVDLPARLMLLAGGLITLGLAVLVLLRIPGLPAVSLGFDVQRRPLPPGPPESLLLLLVLGGFAYVLNLLAGVYFYRHDPTRPIAYLLWGAGVAAPLLPVVGALAAR
jgi:hypothetical protein